MAKYPGACPKNHDLNIYSGCPAECLYCVEKRGHEEHSRLLDSADALWQGLLAANPSSNPVYLSSMTDAYQPLEENLGITGDILSRLAGEDMPFFVITKETLVWRDREFFRDRGNAFLAVSMNSLDDELASRIEPGASSPSARRQLVTDLCSLKDIRVVVKIDPLIPGITDGQRLNDLLEWLASVRPHAVTAETMRADRGMLLRLQEGLTLKEKTRLMRHYPHAGDRIAHPEPGWRLKLFRGIAGFLEQHGIRACFCRASLPESITPHDCRGGY